MAATKAPQSKAPVHKNDKGLAIGYWVALTLKPDAAPLRAYVGQVQALDQYGVRITLVDWLTGGAHGYDFFATWDSISSALVATPDHDIDNFGERARWWQDALQDDKNPDEEKGNSKTD
jgi:hypothetical protein